MVYMFNKKAKQP